MARSRRAGIDRTVLFAPHGTDYSRTNALVARIVNTQPDRLIGFVFVHPHRDRGRIERIVKQAVLGWGFRGIKVHGTDVAAGGTFAGSTPYDEACASAARNGVPLLIDVAGRPNVVDRLATDYPETPIIVAHLGSFADDWPAQEATMRLMARHANVYGDTSGVRRFDSVRWAVQRAGPGKVLFGSDGPWLHPELELGKIKLLGLAPAEERLILGGNLLRLISPNGRFSHSDDLEHRNTVKAQGRCSGYDETMRGRPSTAPQVR